MSPLRSVSSVALIAVACGCGKASSDKSRSDDDGEGRTSKATSAWGVFALSPLQLENPIVKFGRIPGSPDLDVRATARVGAPREGSVDIPMRMACRFGRFRVATTSEMISVQRESFLLSKAGSTDAFARSPTSMGWLGAPDGCEITFRLEPDGKAKASVEPAEETVCWNGYMVVAGACGFPEPARPKERFALHDLTASATLSLEIHAHVQTRDAAPRRGDVTAIARCAGVEDRDDDPAFSKSAFTYAAGESVALEWKLFDQSERPRADCTVTFAWVESKAEPLELGTWCVPNDDGRAREAPKATPGACQ